MVRPLFGAVMPRYGVEHEAVRVLAQKAEALGFHSIWVTDHLQPQSAGGPVLEAWTTLTALAAQTRKVRLGTVVACYTYRHPALFAKMAATLDRLSGGRLEVGLGAGSKDQTGEHGALGLEFPPAEVRIAQLDEYLQVLRRLWCQEAGEVSFRGRFYRLKGALCNSPPLQRPHPPIWVGARKLGLLRLIAREGYGWNWFGLSTEEYARATKRLEELCARAGRSPQSIPRAIFSGIIVGANQSEVEKKIRSACRQRNVGRQDFFERSCTVIWGTFEECVERIRAFTRLGVGMFVLRDYDARASNLIRFGEAMLPSYR